MGRELQKHYGQQPQCVLTMPLLEGLDGFAKMSKSLGNYVGIAEAPREIFGKIMSISDDLMWRYFTLLSFRSLPDIEALKRDVAEGRNPRDIKVLLAHELVSRFHGDLAAERASEAFNSQFRDGIIPDNITCVTITSANADGSVTVAQAMKATGLATSTSEAMRLIQQGGVRVDGVRLDDRDAVMTVGVDVLLQVGRRRVAKVRVQPAQ